MQDVLRDLTEGRTLSEARAEEAFEKILTGGADEAQIGAFLAFIKARGATVDELVGGARVMRRHVTPVDVGTLPDGGVLVDTCGTGGAPKTFNISTAVGFVVAGARGDRRAFVAKHGSRSRSGRGSAEVLETLGVNVAASPATQKQCLHEAGVCFSFAIHHHPAMRFAAGPRASLGMPTIFNLLGPLTNPAGAPHQLMGVYDGDLVEVIAQTHLRLGVGRVLVVHGLDGLDEMTTTDRTTIADVQDGKIVISEVDSASFGLRRSSLNELSFVEDLDGAAALIEEILGGAPGPARDIVVFNTAGALMAAGAAPDLGVGIELATESIDSGEAKRALDSLRALSQGS